MEGEQKVPLRRVITIGITLPSIAPSFFHSRLKTHQFHNPFPSRTAGASPIQGFCFFVCFLRSLVCCLDYFCAILVLTSCGRLSLILSVFKHLLNICTSHDIVSYLKWLTLEISKLCRLSNCVNQSCDGFRHKHWSITTLYQLLTGHYIWLQWRLSVIQCFQDALSIITIHLTLVQPVLTIN